MNIELEDAMIAAGALRDMARASVGMAMKHRTGRHKKRLTVFSRQCLRFARQQGMAARRIQAAVNAEMKRLTTP